MAVVGMASFYGAVSTTPIGMSIIAAELSGNYFLVVPSLIAALIAREVVGRDYLYVNQKDRRLRRVVSLARDLAESLKNAGVTGIRLACGESPPQVISVNELDPDQVVSAVKKLPVIVLLRGSVAGIVSAESLGEYLVGERDTPIEAAPVIVCGADVLDVVDLLVKNNTAYAVLAWKRYRIINVYEALELLENSLQRISHGRVTEQPQSDKTSH